MLGNDAMEFLKTLHNLDEIWKQHDDAEYNDRQLTQFAERYHEHKLKLLGIANLVRRSEQLLCDDCLSDEMDKTLRKENKCVCCGQELAN